jgi:hypothetical protein
MPAWSRTAIAWTPGGNLITANEGDYDLDLAPGQFTGGPQLHHLLTDRYATLRFRRNWKWLSQMRAATAMPLRNRA